MTHGKAHKAHDKHTVKVNAGERRRAEPAAAEPRRGEPAAAEPQRAEPTAAEPQRCEPTAAEQVEQTPAGGDGTAEELRAELDAVVAQRDDYLDHLRRLQAEFDNYRKRIRRDSEDQRTRATQGLVAEILPVLDNMYLACDAAKEHEEGKLVEGVGMVTGQLCDLLKAHGVEDVEAAPGDRFDPNMHEAMSAIPSGEVEEGAIVQVMSRGYRLGERLLRPARVVVSSGPPAGGR